MNDETAQDGPPASRTDAGGPSQAQRALADSMRMPVTARRALRAHLPDSQRSLTARRLEGRYGRGRGGLWSFRRRLDRDSFPAVAVWVGPSYLILVLIMAFPILWNVVESFFSSSYGSTTFVGIANFRQIFESGQFYSSFLLTLYWTAGVFVGQFILGLLLALFFNRRLWVSRFIRPLIVIPWALPGIVSSTAWVFLYSQGGLIDQILSPFFKTGPSWLADPALVMPAVIVAGIWKGAPFYFLMLLAGLQSVPPELQEAAKIDGANRWKILVRVELPYIRNIIALTSVLGLIWTANYFDGIYLMTAGGPVNDTTTLPIWIYNTAFSDFNLSEASALSVILLVLVLLAALPFMLRRGENAT
jgi:multiple sugar transport system permease protein